MVVLGEDAKRVTAAVLADIADLPYFRVDADRNVVEVSPAMERLTGFDARDVVGRSCLRLHRCEECLAGCGVFDNHVVRNKHLQLYRADGSLIDVSKSGRVFLDEDGEITGALEIVRPLEVAPGPADSEPEHGPDTEAGRIVRALERAQYHRTEAARALGMSRTTLWRKMKEHGLLTDSGPNRGRER